jgi:hypothetical protein
MILAPPSDPLCAVVYDVLTERHSPPRPYPYHWRVYPATRLASPEEHEARLAEHFGPRPSGGRGRKRWRERRQALARETVRDGLEIFAALTDFSDTGFGTRVDDDVLETGGLIRAATHVLEGLAHVESRAERTPLRCRVVVRQRGQALALDWVGKQPSFELLSCLQPVCAAHVGKPADRLRAEMLRVDLLAFFASSGLRETQKATVDPVIWP